MNRLSPWIVRRPEKGAVRSRASGSAAAMARPGPFAGVEAAQCLDNLRLFATGWIGGLIFFGTLLG